MSGLNDALTALKNVVLMQERLDVLRREMTDLSTNVAKVEAKVININDRVIRIETMIEMSRSGGMSPPRIEG
ncbi:hypothetical protein D1610_03145 [Sphingomonas gilva]|uniref:Uncharacterized protein n=1 Tax=Sphingomonas gilva TaxID=2305907 RepID=A0A396RSR8_9SPHN|nr:hypothetical protein [Sphingomonas gilva]RHW19126.1 hypothetical protein D1610_03145 [Sphingomonas gilva]